MIFDVFFQFSDFLEHLVNLAQVVVFLVLENILGGGGRAGDDFFGVEILDAEAGEVGGRLADVFLVFFDKCEGFVLVGGCRELVHLAEGFRGKGLAESRGFGMLEVGGGCVT